MKRNPMHLISSEFIISCTCQIVCSHLFFAFQTHLCICRYHFPATTCFMLLWHTLFMHFNYLHFTLSFNTFLMLFTGVKVPKKSLGYFRKEVKKIRCFEETQHFNVMPLKTVPNLENEKERQRASEHEGNQKMKLDVSAIFSKNNGSVSPNNQPERKSCRRVHHPRTTKSHTERL